ncbi:IS5 family transposase [Streptomyces coelicoflavus]|uniref:IS5 family transposase n=1 Tax=Streptomyces coelicoflavus TaxID=285562 RepID=UPI003B983402
MSLTDAQRARTEPLLPDRTPKRGGRWRDHRQMIDAIAFKYRTGTPWMDLPEHFGSRKGTHNRLRKWTADATWEKVSTALLAQADAEGDLDWVASVDSTIVRAHQHTAGTRQKGLPAGKPDHHALGRSHGGLTTKIHLTADSRRPLAFVLTPGQAGDAPTFPEVMTRLRMPPPIGRPRTTPEAVLTDKAYSSRANRTHLRRRGIQAVIPQHGDQATNRKRLGRLGGRPPVFDPEAYKQRNTVERCINTLKQWRALATRYDKTATVYLAGLHVASIFIWSAR